MDRGGVDSAPWRPALVSVKRSASYLNVSRCLVRWMKQVRLPRTRLRMRCVRLVHAYHVLAGTCSHLTHAVVVTCIRMLVLSGDTWCMQSVYTVVREDV